MGSRGPSPTPTAALKLRGSWLAKARKGEPEPKRGIPTCPTWLGAEATREWKRIIKASPDGMLTMIDRSGLAMTCHAWGEFVDAAKRLKTAADHIQITDKGNQMLSPMSLVQQRAYERWLKLAAQFGLTPSARTRIQIETKEVADEFDEFLKRKSG